MSSNNNTNNMNNSINNVNNDINDMDQLPWWVRESDVRAARAQVPNATQVNVHLQATANAALRRQAIVNNALQRHGTATQSIDARRRQAAAQHRAREQTARRVAVRTLAERVAHATGAAQVNPIPPPTPLATVAEVIPQRATTAAAANNSAHDVQLQAVITKIYHQLIFLRANIATADRKLLTMRRAHIVLIKRYLQQIKMHLLALQAGHIIVCAAIAKRRAELAAEAQARRAQRARSSAPPPRDI